jgi:hypothetical protein
MSTVVPLASVLEQRLRQAMDAVLPPEAAGADPLVRPSEHADFQANGILALAKQLRANPRELERIPTCCGPMTSAHELSPMNTVSSAVKPARPRVN